MDGMFSTAISPSNFTTDRLFHGQISDSVGQLWAAARRVRNRATRTMIRSRHDMSAARSSCLPLPNKSQHKGVNKIRCTEILLHQRGAVRRTYRQTSSRRRRSAVAQNIRAPARIVTKKSLTPCFTKAAAQILTFRSTQPAHLFALPIATGVCELQSRQKSVVAWETGSTARNSKPQ
jgi:hypothetical protein